MIALLKEHGVHNYGIYLHAETGRLFAHAEIEDEARWAAIASTEVCQRWWAHMRDIMVTAPSGRPIAEELPEVFHLP